MGGKRRKQPLSLQSYQLPNPTAFSQAAAATRPANTIAQRQRKNDRYPNNQLSNFACAGGCRIAHDAWCKCAWPSSTLPVTPIERGFSSPFGCIALLAQRPALLTFVLAALLLVPLLFLPTTGPVDVQGLKCRTANRDDAFFGRQERCRNKWALPSPPRRSASLQRVPDHCRPACLRTCMCQGLLNISSIEYLTGHQHGCRITEDADITA
jgi:hypothetical protein